jgi:hypothetical protein
MNRPYEVFTIDKDGFLKKVQNLIYTATLEANEKITFYLLGLKMSLLFKYVIY